MVIVAYPNKDKDTWLDFDYWVSEDTPLTLGTTTKSSANNIGNSKTQKPGLFSLWAMNWYKSDVAAMKLLYCSMFGMWGLFWYNDNGELTEACLRTGFVGA